MSGCWLVKSEPEEYSFKDLLREGRVIWDGVRNPQAQRYLRQMKKGDEVFYYHTGREKAVVGLAEVSREAFPDPNDPRYAVVELRPKAQFFQFVPLALFRTEPSLAEFALLRQPRLSVMPVSSEVAHWIKQQARYPA
ncbi:MAG: EVE domain-containing protein [Bacteroidia bacterium]|nr:EVE domain-containing protein [Bacteroidia bacterium]MDW8235692.1 EVE domain-containing protein [Bacteroidia bacterium]